MCYLGYLHYLSYFYTFWATLSYMFFDVLKIHVHFVLLSHYLVYFCLTYIPVCKTIHIQIDTHF